MTTDAEPTRVLIADDHTLMRQGLATLLGLDETIRVVGTAANGHEALAEAERLLPHVVLMDLRMPEMDGIAATAQLKSRHPEIQVLILTTFDDDELVFAALEAGASGYVLKDTPSEQLARDLHAVRLGGGSLSPSVARKLIARVTARTTPPSHEPPAAPARDPRATGWPERTERIDAEGREALSEREIDVLRLVAQGYNNREIGVRLYVTEGTVKNHISSVLSKLHLRDRTQAVLYAKEQGLL